MLDIIKCIDINGNINTSDLFSLLKTKSQKSNDEIFSKLQNFSNFSDFSNYYLNKDYSKNFKCLNKLILNFSNYDDMTSSFETTTEQYISYLIQTILSLNLLLKTQEILNEILISYKNKLNSLKTKNQIENSNQENLFNLIDIFSNISHTHFRCNSSTSTAASNTSLLDLIPHSSSFRNHLSEKEVEKFVDDLEIYDKTPRFKLSLNTIVEEQIENLNENNKINVPDSSLTLSQYVFVDEQNNNINFENEEKQKEENKNKFKNLLQMVKSLYKKALISTEEKIKFKKMIIGKSVIVEKFYDIYQNPNTSKEKLNQEIKKLME